jgi:hypothetical protein
MEVHCYVPYLVHVLRVSKYDSCKLQWSRWEKYTPFYLHYHLQQNVLFIVHNCLLVLKTLLFFHQQHYQI